jgi:hypothetical protein
MSFAQVRIAAGVAALAAPAVLLAADPAAYLERAQTQASGAQVRSFGVPVSNSSGKLQYFDVTTDFTVLPDGTLGPTATVTSVKVKTVRSNLFVKGIYGDTSNFSIDCQVNPSTLADGRQETSVTCGSGAVRMSATWQNGDLTLNTFAQQLLAAKIDQIPWQSYAWGIVTDQSNWNCLRTNQIVAARQDGDTIVLTNFGNSNQSICGNTLLSKQ